MIYKRIDDKKVNVFCPYCKAKVTTLHVTYYLQNKKDYRILQEYFDRCFKVKNITFCPKCGRRF